MPKEIMVAEVMRTRPAASETVSGNADAAARVPTVMRPYRKTTRLRGYDYRQAGAYFCTICVHRRLRRREVWGCVEAGTMRLNRFGHLVEECWRDLPNHHSSVELDAFVVMPNHVHAILLFTQAGFEAPFQATFGPVPANSLSSVMGAFKAAVTRAVNRKRDAQTTVWQERFYERIIRGENELNAIRRYIRENPVNWLQDRCHPDHPEFDWPWNGVAPDDL